MRGIGTTAVFETAAAKGPLARHHLSRHTPPPRQHFRFQPDGYTRLCCGTRPRLTVYCDITYFSSHVCLYIGRAPLRFCSRLIFLRQMTDWLLMCNYFIARAHPFSDQTFLRPTTETSDYSNKNSSDDNVAPLTAPYAAASAFVSIFRAITKYPICGTLHAPETK